MATDDELLLAWRHGDAGAGARLLRRHRPAIARLFVSEAGMDGEDLVQATLLACAEGLYRFRGDSSFRNYLFAIARRKLARYRRDACYRKAHRDISDDADDSTPPLPELLDAHRQLSQLQSALQELPARTQLMLTLHYWEGVGITEIAERVHLPVNTVKCHMRRGRQQLAQILARA